MLFGEQQLCRVGHFFCATHEYELDDFNGGLETETVNIDGVHYFRPFKHMANIKKRFFFFPLSSSD